MCQSRFHEVAKKSLFLDFFVSYVSPISGSILSKRCRISKTINKEKRSQAFFFLSYLYWCNTQEKFVDKKVRKFL